jgi:hypothetical protein
MTLIFYTTSYSITSYHITCLYVMTMSDYYNTVPYHITVSHYYIASHHINMIRTYYESHYGCLTCVAIEVTNERQNPDSVVKIKVSEQRKGVSIGQI